MMKHASVKLLFLNLKDSAHSETTSVFWQAVPRGLALFLGGFSLLNWLARFRSARLDENLWWIDLRWCPPALANSFLVLSAVCLLAFASYPSRSAWRRWLTVLCTA